MAAMLWAVGLTDAMLQTSIECLYDEYLATCPPIVLLVRRGRCGAAGQWISPVQIERTTYVLAFRSG